MKYNHFAYEVLQSIKTGDYKFSQPLDRGELASTINQLRKAGFVMVKAGKRHELTQKGEKALYSYLHEHRPKKSPLKVILCMVIIWVVASTLIVALVF